MRRKSDIRRIFFRVSSVLAVTVVLMGADDKPKQTIDAKGLYVRRAQVLGVESTVK